MKVDENWKQSRILAQNINRLLELPVETSEKYLQIVEEVILHTFLEMVLSAGEESNPGLDQVFEIELPYLGTLVITAHDKHLSTDFVVRPTFYKKLQNVYLKKVSPIIQTCNELLSQELVKQFEEGEIKGE